MTRLTLRKLTGRGGIGKAKAERARCGASKKRCHPARRRRPGQEAAGKWARKRCGAKAESARRLWDCGANLQYPGCEDSAEPRRTYAETKRTSVKPPNPP